MSTRTTNKRKTAKKYKSLKRAFKLGNKYCDIKEAVLNTLGKNSKFYRKGVFKIEFKKDKEYRDLRKTKSIKMILTKGSSDRIYLTMCYYKLTSLKDFFSAVDKVIKKYKKKYNVDMSDAKLIIRLDIDKYGNLLDYENGKKTIRLDKQPAKKYKIGVYLGE